MSPLEDLWPYHGGYGCHVPDGMAADSNTEMASISGDPVGTAGGGSALHRHRGC